LTRYFSVSFKSEPENSHLFMRATKIIGQFPEANDGVVPVSSSRFPLALQAIDLGLIEADHLAGILASNFDQKSFLKALIHTVAELGVSNSALNFKWNAERIANQVAQSNNKVFFRLSHSQNGAALSQFSNRFQSWIQRGKPATEFSNLAELNRFALPAVNDPAADYLVQTKLPDNQLNFDPYAAIDVSKMNSLLAQKMVSLLTPSSSPQGVRMDFNHKNIVHFRMDHQLNYESRSPENNDDNADYGYLSTEGTDGRWALLRSKKNSIRLTTMAYRFKVSDFKNVSLRLKVSKTVERAQVIKGGTGKDDSAFQVWLTLREKIGNQPRNRLDLNQDKVLLFGYYWGGTDNNYETQSGALFENYYSKKNVVVATLPEAHQILLDDPRQLNKDKIYQRNLVEDLKRAFPNHKVEDLDVIGITFQQDSNDTGSSSDAAFKWLRFLP
jgi:hypothetical protein